MEKLILLIISLLELTNSWLLNFTETGFRWASFMDPRFVFHK